VLGDEPAEPVECGHAGLGFLETECANERSVAVDKRPLSVDDD
jgi:hypothetical protein